jgi:uncharacterized protein (DUF1778 family)
MQKSRFLLSGQQTLQFAKKPLSTTHKLSEIHLAARNKCTHITTMPRTASKTNPPLRAKEDRLVARVSRADKEVIERGAKVAGISVANFLISHARSAAELLIREDGVIRLTAEESRKLMDALLAPPTPPTTAAKKALARYRQSVLSDVNPASQG